MGKLQALPCLLALHLLFTGVQQVVSRIKGEQFPASAPPSAGSERGYARGFLATASQIANKLKSYFLN